MFLIYLSREAFKLDSMTEHLAETLLGLLRRRGAQTFVVLDDVLGPVLGLRLPLVELCQRIER